MSSAQQSPGFVPLPEKETRLLIAAAQEGDFAAKEKLVAVNTRLVRSIARRFAASGRDTEDLFQIGCIGLLKAIDKFDFSYDVHFSTYAVPLIMGEIRRFLRDDGPMTVSRNLKEKALRLEQKRRELHHIWGAEPELWQLAEACSITEEEALAALEAMRPPLSIQEIRYYGDHSSVSLGDILPDDEAVFDTRLVESMDLQQYIDALPARLASIVRGRYFEERTQAEMAKRLGVSQVQISRLEKQALAMIRDRMLRNEASAPDCG